MNNNLETLVKQHGGKWVALKPNTNNVVVSGQDAVKVYKSAQKKGLKIPTMFKVPIKLVPFIGQLHAI